MYISTQTKQAYTEIDNFIELLAEDDKNKIPKKLRQFFKKEKDEEYKKNINIDIPIKEQNLKEETLALIALLNLKYICDDNKEKERLTKVYYDNDKKYQETIKEKYNPDNLFKKKYNFEEGIQHEFSIETEIVEYEEKNFIQKLFNKIKNLFKRN